MMDGNDLRLDDGGRSCAAVLIFWRDCDALGAFATAGEAMICM